MKNYEIYFTNSRKLDNSLTPASWEWPVLPEYSVLGTSETLTKTIKESYPDLLFNQASLIDGNLIILDILPGAPKEKREEALRMTNDLNNDSKTTIQVVDGAVLTERMLSLTNSSLSNLDENSLVVYLLEAGRDVQEFINSSQINPLLTRPRSILIPVEKRLTGRDELQKYIDPNSFETNFIPNQILVIDDVIASGETLQAARVSLRRKFGFEIPLSFASWIYLSEGQEFRKSESSGVDGYEKGVASLVISGNSGIRRPPINSLSCLLNPKRKSPQIASLYAAKYFYEQQQFYQILAKIKESI